MERVCEKPKDLARKCRLLSPLVFGAIVHNAAVFVVFCSVRLLLRFQLLVLSETTENYVYARCISVCLCVCVQADMYVFHVDTILHLAQHFAHH